MTTKYKLSEQIQRILQGGDPAASARITRKEIELAIEQVLNRLLKTERFNNLNEGESYPSDILVAEYDNVAVTTYKDTSKCTLPAIPIALPRGRGVWHVSGTSTPNDPYIPLQPGQWALVKNQRILGDMSDLIGYEVKGKELVFTKNLPGISVNSVLIRLLVADFSQLGDYDMLPMPADMEDAVIRSVLELFGVYQKADKIVDGTDNKV
jgi:hypothetical protein